MRYIKLNNNIVTDISFKKEDSNYIEITDLEYEKIKKGCSYGKGGVIETEEYLKNISDEELEKINTEFQDTIKTFTSGYSQAEIDTWNTKVNEAKNVLAGGTSDLLNSLLLKGEILIDFANNILLKSNEYSKIYYEAERIKRERLKALK